MGAMYPEYAEWLHNVRESMQLPKAVKLLFEQGRLYLAPVTEAHSEADDSIRRQLADQLPTGSGLHVTRDKGLNPEIDGYRPEPDVLVVDAGVLGPRDAYIDQKHVHFVSESVSRATVGNDYGRKLNQYAARGIPTYLIVDVLVGECVLYQAPKGEEYTSAVPYRFGEAVSFEIAGTPAPYAPTSGRSSEPRQERWARNCAPGHRPTFGVAGRAALFGDTASRPFRLPGRVPIVKLMLNHDVGRVFHALADPTRRVIVERLVRGPASVSELARPLAMSLPAVVQHLAVLEESGLVSSEKVGRVRTCRVEPDALRAAEGWLSGQRTLWERRLDRLDALLAEPPQVEEE